MPVQPNENGLYCERGGFYVDPWAPVERAIVTHAHSDHACAGSRRYLTARPGKPLLRARVGPDAAIETLDYGESIALNGVRVSLHPAGHIPGSAQVRIECGGEVCVVSGDYKLEADPTCAPFEPVRCHTFFTEAAFGLPVFRWPRQAEVMAEIAAWWRANRQAGKASVLFAHAFGEAQRVLAGIDASAGPIFTHAAIARVNELYGECGVALPRTANVDEAPAGADWNHALILAPPMISMSEWLRRFGAVSTALASGWMRIRGTRRRRSLDRGFVLSGHADWPQLMAAIEATGAERIRITHGYRAPVVQWLQEKGLDAAAVETRFEADRDEVSGEEI